jgi:hypothetical protein
MGGHTSLDPTTPTSEVTATLYAQTDSAGVLKESDKTNNIYSVGTQICLASPDAYENALSDDDIASARLISLYQDYSHNFSKPGDKDWSKFIAFAGRSYVINTSDLGTNADTYLYLYGPDGTTLLASNDDSNGSLASTILWTAPTSGTYYVLVTAWNPSSGGCGTGYKLSLNMIKQGDVNCDQTISSVDALFDLQFDVGLRQAGHVCSLPTTNLFNIEQCDVNSDGSCGSVDSLFVLQCTVGLHNPLCPSASMSNIVPHKTLTPGSIIAGSGKGLPQSSLTIPISLVLPLGASPGATTVEIQYDPAVVHPTACTVDPDNQFDMRLCNIDYENDGQGTDSVRVSLVSSAGAANQEVLARITFQLIGNAGDTTNLGVSVVTLTDPVGASIATNNQDGVIDIVSTAQVFLPFVNR